VRTIATRYRRLPLFGYSLRDRLPIADIRLRLACARPECGAIVSALAYNLRRYRSEDDGAFSRLFKATAAVTDFDLFPDAERYLRAVSRETSGKYHRSANKARRAGYFVAEIQPGSYAQSLYDIKASKLRRSHGIVSEAAGIGRRPEDDIKWPLRAPQCAEHWRTDWGLFSKSDARMWGFASLLRAGNLAYLDHMLCHADVLTKGGMKLLHFEMMKQLLDRSIPKFEGIGYLVHGAIEDGEQGAADWRRYVQQRPHAIKVSMAEVLALPPDFDPQSYLDLNPDVRAAGCDPKKHYLKHGMLEGRAYKGGGVPPS